MRINLESMRIKNRKIKELNPAKYNPRYLTKKQREELLVSLKKFGLVSPIIINVNPERKDIVIGGHQRLQLWQFLGYKTVPCIELNLSEDDERELNVRLNKNNGEFDISMLKQEFTQQELKDWGFEPFEIGLDEFTLEGEGVEYIEPITVEGIDEGNTEGDLTVKESVSQLKDRIGDLLKALKDVVETYEGDGMEQMGNRDEFIYNSCKEAIEREERFNNEDVKF